jgi:hypothetical protein
MIGVKFSLRKCTCFSQEYLLGAFWFSQSIVVSTMYRQDVWENYLVFLVYKCVKHI